MYQHSLFLSALSFAPLLVIKIHFDTQHFFIKSPKNTKNAQKTCFKAKKRSKILHIQKKALPLHRF